MYSISQVDYSIVITNTILVRVWYLHFVECIVAYVWNEPGLCRSHACCCPVTNWVKSSLYADHIKRSLLFLGRLFMPLTTTALQLDKHLTKFQSVAQSPDLYSWQRTWGFCLPRERDYTVGPPVSSFELSSVAGRELLIHIHKRQPAFGILVDRLLTLTVQELPTTTFASDKVGCVCSVAYDWKSLVTPYDASSSL